MHLRYTIFFLKPKPFTIILFFGHKYKRFSIYNLLTKVMMMHFDRIKNSNCQGKLKVFSVLISAVETTDF